jgi:hypothetical protein
MNRNALTCILALFAVVMGTVALRADSPAGVDPRDKEIATLRGKVADQGKKIAALNAKVKAMNSALKALGQNGVADTRPLPVSPDNQPPKGPPGSVRVPFNDDYYYLVPLNDESRAASAVSTKPSLSTSSASSRQDGRAR